MLAIGLTAFTAYADGPTAEPFEISGENQITIGRGETIQLVGPADSASDLTITVNDENAELVAEFHVSSADCHTPLAIPFDQAGLFTVTATISDEIVGVLHVAVVYVDFHAPIVCAIGHHCTFKDDQCKEYTSKQVTIFGNPAAVFFTPENPDALKISVYKYIAPGTLTSVHTVPDKPQYEIQGDLSAYSALDAVLRIHPLQPGNPVILVRLGSPTGPVIGRQVVETFALDWTSIGHTRVDAVMEKRKYKIIMKPYIPNVIFTLGLINPVENNACFDGGTTNHTTLSNDCLIFTNLAGQVCAAYEPPPVIMPVTGTQRITLKHTVRRPPDK
ncbi:MAG: hypothetical protein H7831_16160 [Magnetococcus sp. WYHC-3]